MYNECAVTTQQRFLGPPLETLHGRNANMMPEILQYLGTEIYADSLSSEPGVGQVGAAFLLEGTNGNTHGI